MDNTANTDPQLTLEEALAALEKSQAELAQAKSQQIQTEQALAEAQQTADHYQQLFETTQATLIKTESLYELSRLLTMFSDLPTLLQAVVDGIANALPADRVVLVMIDVSRQAITQFVRGGSWTDRRSTPPYQELSQGVVGQTLREQKPRLITATEQADSLRSVFSNGAMMLVPMQVRYHDTIRGVLITLNRPEQGDFQSADLKLLAAIADQTATGIDSALLFESLQSHAQQLEEKNSSLAQLNRLKDEFLANTSHALRTPLNGIVGIAESMLNGVTGSLTATQTYNLSMIVSSGQRLMNLVNDILDSAHLNGDSISLQIQPIDLYSVVDTILTFSQPMVKGRLLHLRNEVGPNLPPVAADEGRLQQIFYNLVENAVKATEKGSVTITAHICEWHDQSDQADTASLNPATLEIIVTDTGSGIEAEKLETIKEMLEQAVNAPLPSADHIGLGLLITHKLIRLHGGTFDLKSTVGQGSRVTFTLPVSQKKAVMSRKAPDEAAMVRQAMTRTILRAPRSTDTDRFSVLVVDDEPFTRLMLRNYLSLYDFDIIEAEDGFQALDVLASVTPDLILLDIMMPRLSGYDVCFKIRQVRPAYELPIILLTARNQVADILAGFEVGANDYVTKPISQDELLARMKTHLNLSKINTAYGRFVPEEFLHLLGRDSIVDVKLGDQVQQQMTVLFADLRSFTTLSERMTPQENFEFLNTLLGDIGPLIREHNGFIDKYIGDAIMALFPTSADDALNASIAMLREIETFNHDHDYGQPIKMGIGLHTGNLILGTVGEAERMDTTVISDVVNTAARLEGLTKQYQVNLIISRDTFNDLSEPQAYQTRFLGKVQVKGKHKLTEIYEVFDSDQLALREMKAATQAIFEQGVHCYHNHDLAQAAAHMEDLLRQFPHDTTAQLYLTRIQAKTASHLSLSQ